MQRSTSFFWATDDLQYLGNDNEGDENDNPDRVGRGIGFSVSIDEEDEEEGNDDTDEFEEEIQVLESSTHERNGLNVDNNFKGYGSAVTEEDAGDNIENGANHEQHPPGIRRRLFDPLMSKDRSEKPYSYSPSRAQGISASATIPTTYHPASITKKDVNTIRFQVVIWHIGTIDVQTGFVKMRFRLTLFWNDGRKDINSPNKTKNIDSSTVWVMEGRQHAYRKTWKHQHDDAVNEMIDVPPVSILNAVEFDTVDTPEVTMINTQTRSMRWTCMYSATLFQGDHMSVKDFPHDEHQIKLKLGILAHRGKGGRWDHNIHKLALADEDDSKGSTRVPHGLVVDHCHVPDFGFDPTDLSFRFYPLSFGGWKKPETKLNKYTRDDEGDVFLQVTLPVYRQSAHYDTSILPILVVLNIIAISCLTRNFGSASAATEIMLSIAFVQVGIRLTLDSRLPSVGYQIKMQTVMNNCFWLLCALVLESNYVFFLVKKRGWDLDSTDRIDAGTASVALVYNAYIIWTYFRGKRRSVPAP